MARATNRVRALTGAMVGALRRARLRLRPIQPRRILVLHELLLGDTLMLAPLLAALRHRYPAAELLVTVNPAYAGLLSGNPYGAKALPYSEKLPDALGALAPAGNCDIAIVPGDNRHAVAARAIGAKWVVGFAGGKRTWRNRAVDELMEFPAHPEALAEIFMRLAGLDEDVRCSLRYRPGDWPAPAFDEFERPCQPYAVLHVGAGSPLRLWQPENWRMVAQTLSGHGLTVVWTASTDEVGLVRSIDPQGRFKSFAGKLDLAQLWHLLAEARLAVALDSGISHLAKLTRTPVVTLYGPGSEQLFGKGRFWDGNAFSALTVRDFACRDQRALFEREITWVKRCNRSLADCPRARCMESITSDQVIAALQVQ